ncbi:rhodanese-like domain-containing protein [Spiroplasma tabanidicola]|uniref:Rhodanese domain-containing protein n=1 Tax=Spiroplasma tabanidicola TaxID=324079 RepID=A0A6I6C9S1_9MOLU|nr:rhodanese-like domain-containing protein [Spiroplasma tabanidicola]QGS51675.1 hypothetical protein STABA_v1c03120 [Spiroplasma tabanidicola]
MRSISYEEFKQIENDPDVLIIDVRTDMEYKTLPKVPNSINCEISKLLSNYQAIVGNDKKRLIVTVCNAGNRSGESAEFLSEKGYNAKVLIGGAYGYSRKK